MMLWIFTTLLHMCFILLEFTGVQSWVDDRKPKWEEQVEARKGRNGSTETKINGSTAGEESDLPSIEGPRHIGKLSGQEYYCMKYNRNQFTTSLIPSGDSACCNGILGFAGNRRFMPCSEMRCCNQSETVALERVNHAVGFCFRCVAKDYFNSKCYSSGQEVATTNNTDVLYELRTCCQGLKFKVILHSNDVAMVIKCVAR